VIHLHAGRKEKKDKRLDRALRKRADPRGVAPKGSSDTFAGVLVEVFPFEFATAQEVEMKVMDLLAAIVSIVGDEAVAGGVEPQFGGGLLDEGGHLRHGLPIGLLEAANVLFGDDQDMNRSFGIKVVKGEKLLVFMDGVVGDLPFDDLAEDTHRGLLEMDLGNYSEWQDGLERRAESRKLRAKSEKLRANIVR
jgi:hypothetical protein